MPSFFRSLSQRFRSPKPPRNVQTNAEQQKPTTSKVHQSPPPEINTRKEALCKVLLLDGTDLSIVISRKALADDVYRQVYQRLDLEERDYFGLQFTDHYHVSHWLDPLKPIKKQVPIGPPYTFRFRVKFYSSEPNKLREELTRYQFFLQLKQDIQLGKLECGKDLAIELAALALQSEFGDYNPREHTVLFVSEFRFHPQQDELMEVAILENYKECRGQTPAEAEMNYLNKAKWIELYGVDQHRVEGKDGNEYKLGLTPTGMLVFDGPQKIGLFLWEKIQRLDFRNKKLTLVVEEDAEKVIQLHTFVFELTSHKACKHLWKCAIEHHTFFRLKFHRPPKRARDQFFRLGSTFKHRGRTEYENVHREEQKAAAHRRTNSAFQRRPSQRYLPRQSHIRQKVLLQEKPPDTSDALAKETTVIPATPASNVSSSVINASAPSKPADKVAAAEARLDSLIFAPVPTAVTTLSESPNSGRKNGQRQTPIAQFAPESSFPSTKVLAETTNGLPKEHVTKIEISDKPYVAVKQSVPQQDLYKPTIQANPLATTIPVTLIPSNVTAPAVKCENSVSENLQPLSSATSVADNHRLDSNNASFTNTQGTNISEREKKAETPQPAVPSKIPTITPIPSKKVPSKSQLPTRISRSNIPITAPKSSAVVGSTVTNIPVHTSRIH